MKAKFFLHLREKNGKMIKIIKNIHNFIEK